MKNINHIEPIKYLPKDPVKAHEVLIDKILDILKAEFNMIKNTEDSVKKLGVWLKLLTILVVIALFRIEISNYISSGFNFAKKLSVDSYFNLFYVVPITAVVSLVVQKFLSRIKK